jgi:uncharacterized protein (TIGR02996 family)
LHAEVLQSPDADEPRVAYAHAVQGSDPDRAELIRVQLRLARSRRKGLPPLDRADDYTRESVLLERHKTAWSRRVTGIPGVQFVRFLRGFVGQVRIDAADFLLRGEELYSRAPVLHVDLVELAPHAREVFASPLLDRIHSLRLSRNQLDDAAARALAASPHLGRLRWLDLSYNRIGQEGLEAICASTQLPSLRYLDFANNAAPDPTPKIGETDMDTNEVISLEISPEARALEARFGKKPWLSPEFVGTMFPPERDLF